VCAPALPVIFYCLIQSYRAIRKEPPALATTVLQRLFQTPDTIDSIQIVVTT
jgi:hypothetical protein